MHALLLYSALVSFGASNRTQAFQTVQADYQDIAVACDATTDKCWMIPQTVYPGKTCQYFQELDRRSPDVLTAHITCADTPDGAKLDVSWLSQ